MAENEKDVPIKEQEDGSVLAKIELPETLDDHEEEKPKKKKEDDEDHEDDDLEPDPDEIGRAHV